MNLYPAIDIIGGRAVRLRQGRREELTDYGTPLEMACRWAEAGADWLHVVDLDGAFAGRRIHRGIVAEIKEALPTVRVQTGGGIRDIGTVEELLGEGADRIILGTAAVEDDAFLALALARFPGQVAVGIDARDGRVRLDGWTADVPMTALELARRTESIGVSLIVYTDISRDGEFGGVNIDATSAMLDETRLRVIASGGIAGLEDIRQLQELRHPRLEGAVIGKALYEGRLDLVEAFAVTRAG